MEILKQVFVGLVAVEHLYILFIEMFAWNTKGKTVFKGIMPDEMFDSTVTMAANQGLYNGFLAAGLAWTFFIADPEWQYKIAVFFLICVIAAGVYGSLTLSKKIFFTQACPAIIALLLVLFVK